MNALDEAIEIRANPDRLFDGPHLKRVVIGLLPSAIRYERIRTAYCKDTGLSPEQFDKKMDEEFQLTP